MKQCIHRLVAVSVLSVLVAGLASIVSAQTTNIVNVDFNTATSPTYTGKTPVDNSMSYQFNGWVLGGGSPKNSGTLQYSDGAGGALQTWSGISITISNYSGSWSDSASSTAAPNLYTDYVFAGSSGAVRPFTISGLNTDNTYNLYLYSTAANYSGYGALFTVQGSSLTASGVLTNTFVNLQNYVVFTGLTPDSSGNIQGSWQKPPTGPPDRDGDWNGFTLLEISAIPEPSALSLVGAGLLLLVATRRRRS